MLVLSSNSADATRRIGRRLAEVLPRPAIVLLRGDYGSGKTTLVQGLAAGLQVPGAVRSPSYNIVKLYQGNNGSLVHVDLYRAHNPAEIDELGIWEFISDDTIVAIEWPGELAPSAYEYSLLTIEFELADAAAAAGAGVDSERTLRLIAAEQQLTQFEGALSEFTAR
jgi:tRNA threonylcarbamoyladenosine biosynthesis protein TsaE